VCGGVNGTTGNDDEKAMKAASHDLKGLVYYSSCGVAGLSYPLMSLIDYLGYRLIAMSILCVRCIRG
jgi:hypothetical protein